MFGVDVSEATARQARAGFAPARLRPAVADVRQLPFRDESFDGIDSMGTIEHFHDPDTAVGEMYRVLKPGGRAIVGVPNRWDPFLRPLLVEILWRLGAYAYGYERSFSRPALRRMLETAGFRVLAESGHSVHPGRLRMLDLACHVYAPPLARLARPRAGDSHRPVHDRPHLKAA